MPREKILYTSVEWFDVPDDVRTDDLPEELIDAQQKWGDNTETSSPELCEVIEKFIVCNYIAENMSGWEAMFPDNNFGEFTACKVEVVGVKFSARKLPSVCAQAWIPITVLDNVSDEDLDEWAEEEWGMHSGVIWSWDLNIDDDIDLGMESHSGAEACWVQDVPQWIKRCSLFKKRHQG